VPHRAGCFAADTANGQIVEDPSIGCSYPYQWDLWAAFIVNSYHSNTLYQLENVWTDQNGGCLYDDEQPTAVYTTNGCSDTDSFEAFSWTGSNL
jgi:hypothetical protein